MAWVEHRTRDGIQEFRGRWRAEGRKPATEWLPYEGQAKWMAELAEQGQLTLDGEGHAQAPKSPAGTTVASHTADWLARVKRLKSHRTWLSYRGRVISFLAGTPLAGTPIKDVTWQQVEDWRLAVADQVAPSTANHAFSVFSIMFRDAVFHGVVPSPQPVMKHDPVKGKVRKAWKLTGPEEADLLAAAAADGPVWHILCLIMLDAGLRFGEASALTVQAIDEDHLEVLHAVDGKRQLAAPKGMNHSGADEDPRRIPLSPRLKAALKPWVAAAKLKGGRRALLFPSRTGQPIHTDTWQDHFNTIKAEAFGVDAGDITPHHLRHTFAKKMQLQGLDVTDIQYLLGHEDLRTTQTYLGLSKANHDRMAAAIAG